MTTDTVFSIVSILVVRITKVGYGWKANEFIFPTILRYVMYITYRVFLKMTKVDAFFLAHLIYRSPFFKKRVLKPKVATLGTEK